MSLLADGQGRRDGARSVGGGVWASVALGLVLLGVGGTGCGQGLFAKTQAPEAAKEVPPVPVEVEVLAQGSIEAVIRTSTHLEAESEVKVFGRTANRVTELLVEEGHKVSKDQVLLRLEDDIQKNQFEKAKSNHDKAQREYERLRALHDQRLVSDQAFNDGQFELRQRELALEDARRELEYTQVRAPIGGTVTRRMVKAGDWVMVGQHLFDLVDFDSIVARVYVPERELPRLSEGQSVRVMATPLPGVVCPGYVQRISPIVEARTGTVKVTVAFRDVGPLRPGMYVDTEVVTAQRSDALLVPKRALVYDGDQLFVFRVGTNRVVERLLVQPRVTDKEYVEPATGFGVGDAIVVAGQTGLKDGARVRLPGDPEGDAKPGGKESTAAKGASGTGKS